MASLAGADAPLPPHRELLEVIRANVSGLADAELDRAAAGALLAKVRGRVLAPADVAEPVSDEPAIVTRAVYDNCAYVRVGQVTLALAPQLAAALQSADFAASRGLVLDLRFAVGTDYQAAANVVALFLNTEKTVLSWGDRQGLSTAQTNAWTRPVTVLVNHDTRGGAEALAAALRQQRLGILIGGPTAGVAAVFKEVPLGDGNPNRLRLAVSVVKTADGQALSETGVEPDILVRMRAEQDRAYLADPYTIVLSSSAMGGSGAGTNTLTGATTVVRKRVSEADLVRQKRDVEAAVRGVGSDALPAGSASTNAPASAPRPTPAEVARVIKDPVLGRAIDLLKGLAFLGSDRP